MDNEAIEAAAAAWVFRRSVDTRTVSDQERLDSWLTEPPGESRREGPCAGCGVLKARSPCAGSAICATPQGRTTESSSLGRQVRMRDDGAVDDRLRRS
jgi:hypothetical protein